MESCLAGNKVPTTSLFLGTCWIVVGTCFFLFFLVSAFLKEVIFGGNEIKKWSVWQSNHRPLFPSPAAINFSLLNCAAGEIGNWVKRNCVWMVAAVTRKEMRNHPPQIQFLKGIEDSWCPKLLTFKQTSGTSSHIFVFLKNVFLGESVGKR